MAIQTNQIVYTVNEIRLSGGQTVSGNVTVQVDYDGAQLNYSTPRVVNVDLEVDGGTSSRQGSPSSKGFNAEFNDKSSLSSTDHLGASISIDPSGKLSLKFEQNDLEDINTASKKFDNYDKLEINFTDASILTPRMESPTFQNINVSEVFYVKPNLINTSSFSDSDNIAPDRSHYISSSEQTIVCYVKSTGIQTQKGVVPVEEIKVGDLLLTVDGQYKPVTWIGFNTIDCRRQDNKDHAYPVRIHQHAFGFNLPSRDLYVSPLHSIYVSGVMIPAIHLVNGVTVTQDRQETLVTYYHVELPAHDAVYAEGLPAETYLDTSPENRNFFKQGEGDAKVFEIGTQYPACPQGTQAWQHIWNTQGYAPLIQEGPVLEAVKESLMEHSVLAQERQRLAA